MLNDEIDKKNSIKKMIKKITQGNLYIIIN